jgi:putative ribosome biogenesis GTPase RsgA
MLDTYGGRGVIRDGRLVSTYAVGDRIRWTDEKGRERKGVVVEVLSEDTYHVRSHVPDHGNLHFAVTEEQAMPF